MDAAAVDQQWRNHGQFLLRQLGTKGVLFENLCIAPALRPIELGDQRCCFVDTYLINAVFVTVKPKQAAVAAQVQLFHGIEDEIRRQGIERMR